MTTHSIYPIEDGCTVLVPISALNAAVSPRLMGEDTEHIQTLASVVSRLPPIIVHRDTMRIIDGMHRVRAAMQRGQETIEARLFDGTENEAFVLAVKENIRHGLPLSLADRKAAAARIIADYPEWSDRAVAAMAGLSPSSVGAVRKRSTDRSGQLNHRIGRDGRARPVDAAARRKRVIELIAEQPHATLRQIAKEAEVSVGTAHAVRKRMMQAGNRPVPLANRVPREGEAQPAPARSTPARSGAAAAERLDWVSLRQRLRADPALRYTDSGRNLLQWLDAHSMSPDEWSPVVESIPPHWLTALANLAHQFSREWHVLAKKLQQKAEMERDGEVGGA